LISAMDSMMTNGNSSLKKNETYYEALGSHFGIPTAGDYYRFRSAKGWLVGDSILDVGCGLGDFLNSIKTTYRIAGIEVNSVRVEYTNRRLGQDTVKLGNLDLGLDFEDDSFDTVTCLELLEHLEDPQKALEELVRVSRKRVIITVPFKETIKSVLCIHCAKYTPYSGHLHSFDETSIRDIIPHNASIVKMELCSNRLLRHIPYVNKIIFKAPQCIISILDSLANRIFPRANWLMVILDKNNNHDNQH